MHSSATLAAGAVALLAGAAQAQYSLDVSYDTSNFFDTFDFFTDTDPTSGFVQYVDGGTANTAGLAGYAQDAIFMGVDYTTENPEAGRMSVRLTSQQSFTHGLFVADIAHMPGSICGVWPAFWMFGPSWPTSGEIDIIEGVNAAGDNTVTLHTSPSCEITNSGSVASTILQSATCDSGNGGDGCSQSTGDNQNYGDGFNDLGGGVYATEWNSDHIAVWFFPRSAIPGDITSGSPDPSGWGAPTAQFEGGSGCDLDDHFMNNQLVFDTTFCGDWAGSVWSDDSTCSALASTCEDYVAANPSAFEDAYWLVNSIKVYTEPGTSKREVVPQVFRA